MRKYELYKVYTEVRAHTGNIKDRLKKSELIDAYISSGMHDYTSRMVAEFDNREDALEELKKYKCSAEEGKYITYYWNCTFYLVSEFEIDEDGCGEETGNYDFAEMEEDEEE